MSFNTNKYFAIRSIAQKKFINVPSTSGIYLWKRIDNDITYWYVGQAKNIKNRRIDYYLVQSGATYPKRHFECSLKSHKDWEFSIIETCNVENLNEREQYWIKEYLKKPLHITRNSTIGGQNGTKALGERSKYTPKKHINEFRDTLERTLYKNLSHLNLVSKNACIEIRPKTKKDDSPTALGLKALEFVKEFLNK